LGEIVTETRIPEKFESTSIGFLRCETGADT